MATWIHDFWPIVITLGSILIWSSRQEGRLTNLEKNTASVERVAKLEGEVDGISFQMSEVKATLIRVDTKMDTMLSSTSASLAIAQERQRHERTRSTDPR